MTDFLHHCVRVTSGGESLSEEAQLNLVSYARRLEVLVKSAINIFTVDHLYEPRKPSQERWLVEAKVDIEYPS